MSRLALTARLARRTATALAVGTLAATLATSPLAAQDSDTTAALPFRAGQWATQFGFDGSFLSAGAMRFRSNRTAWVVDAFGSATHLTYDNPPDIVNEDEREATDFFFGAQLGMRSYRRVASRANAFTGVGLFGQSYASRTPFFSGTELYTQREGAAGLYGELGATWMVNRNLGLSAATQLAASYNWTKIEQPTGFGPTQKLEGTGYGVRLSRTRLMVTVFF